MASTIQAIGRCASNISEVTDTCLAGLVRLLSNRDGKHFLHHFAGLCNQVYDATVSRAKNTVLKYQHGQKTVLIVKPWSVEKKIVNLVLYNLSVNRGCGGRKCGGHQETSSAQGESGIRLVFYQTTFKFKDNQLLL